MKERFLNFKLQKKIFITYFIICILPITILGYFCYIQTRNLLIRQETASLERSFEQAVNAMDNQREQLMNVASYTIFNQQILNIVYHEYSSYFEMYQKFNNELSPYFQMIQALHEEIQLMTIYTTNTIEEYGDLIVPMNKEEAEDWHVNVMRGSKSKWYTDSFRKVIFVVWFLEDNKKNYESLLYTEYNYKQFFEPLSALSSSESGIYVFDSAERVIFQNHSFEEEAYILAKEEVYGAEGTSLITPQGEYACIVRDIENIGWKIYYYKPMSMISSLSKNIIYTMFTLIVICFILVIFLGFGMSHIIVSRIEKLTKHMKDIEVDNLSVSLSDNGEDEIGILIRSFNKLILRIQHLIQEVYKSETTRREYEMKALQAQINPHFLYNSLSLINWKAIMAGEEEISQMSQLLSTFYRTLLNKGNAIITVEDEVNYIKAYIEIQNMMHDYNIEIIYQFDEEIFHYYMIHLLLQPLVENAIMHGLDHKRDNKGVLTFCGTIREDCLVFMVEDNGAGMTKEQCSAILTTKTEGYGVKNVFDRIKLCYGDGYGLSYESCLGEGTKVILKVRANRREDFTFTG